MKPSVRRLLVAALLACVPGAAAATAAPAPVPLRLLSPAPGTALAAGSTATLEWAPGAVGEGWDEWEAFLSLDDGASYPIRITPHLDRGLRRVAFRVPDFPTVRARLLLRLGDERRERVFELPQRFAIVAAPRGLEKARGDLLLARVTGRRGEPARPGDPGVVSWVEGTRAGGETREVVAVLPPRAEPAVAPSWGGAAPVAVVSPAPRSNPPAGSSGAPALAPPSRFAVSTIARRLTPRALDILLLIQRQNE
jgi:hypothetical protein